MISVSMTSDTKPPEDFFEMELNVMEVAAITGHKDLRILQRYAHYQSSRIGEQIWLIAIQRLIMMSDAFKLMLSGGHPNSLGRSSEVVEIILSEPNKLDELYNCYFSSDEIVRMRTSNVFKKISEEHPDWLSPFIDRFTGEVSNINQASTQWTLAILFNNLFEFFLPDNLPKQRMS